MGLKTSRAQGVCELFHLQISLVLVLDVFNSNCTFTVRKSQLGSVFQPCREKPLGLAGFHVHSHQMMTFTLQKSHHGGPEWKDLELCLHQRNQLTKEIKCVLVIKYSPIEVIYLIVTCLKDGKNYWFILNCNRINEWNWTLSRANWGKMYCL